MAQNSGSTAELVVLVHWSSLISEVLPRRAGQLVYKGSHYFVKVPQRWGCHTRTILVRELTTVFDIRQPVTHRAVA